MDQRTEDLLNLAQEAGNLGVFEWLVQAGTVQVSPKFLLLYGLEAFDGRYESWLKCVFREDKPLLVDQTERAFAAHVREAKAEFRIVRASDGALKWIESLSIIFYGARGQAVRVVSVHADVAE
jgi:PAS domain-containing protein